MTGAEACGGDSALRWTLGPGRTRWPDSLKNMLGEEKDVIPPFLVDFFLIVFLTDRRSLVCESTPFPITKDDNTLGFSGRMTCP
jgi:hypothetical protein